MISALCGGRLPKLVMFDLDGTLIDSIDGLAGAVNSMLQQCRRAPVAVEQVRMWVGNGAPVLVRRALAGQLDHAAVDDAAASEALALFYDAYAGAHASSSLYPGVNPTLGWLRSQGVELALISNKPERFVGPLLDDLKIGHYFRWVIGGDTLPQQKPDPAALLFVMRMAGVSASEALFVGDSRNDVLAARAAGVPCAAMSYGYNHGRPIAEERPQAVLDDLLELLDAV
ncbi:TPA: phosphoglycolate phosphatase [Klebsiella pneumoniae]